ncbi:MAG: Holliday junction branch migration protein RuvA [Rikenellaceae bacterium]|nr:Holliday junction branch migration protein RuvA [Rikenellaceae bacterium]
MYEYICGKVAEAAPTYAVIEAAGVGYYLNISLETYTAIEKATEAKLWVHFIVREDTQQLYGFASREERELFRLLIGVSGVGGGTARMILSTYSPKELQQIISAGNAVLLKNVKGLGLKTAQKIIVDLAGKVMTIRGGADPFEEAMSSNQSTTRPEEQEALEALQMLGFQKAASEKALKAIVKEQPDASVEELIRAALKRL